MNITVSQLPFAEITPIIPYVRQAQLKIEDKKNTVWFGAMYEKELVGIGAYSIRKNVVLFQTGFVKEEYRKKGIYSLIFKEKMRRISKLDIRKIKAFCTPNSVNIFLQNGFNIVGKSRNITVVERKLKVNTRESEEKVTLTDLCNVIKGNVVSGDKNLPIYHITDRSLYLKKSNTLLFIRGRLSKIDWRFVRKFQPCAIVYEKGQKQMPYLPGFTYIMVENMERSYWDFVNYYRGLFDIPVFAITGTCGKTTTKEMIVHILEGKYKVQSTIKSNNSFYRNLGYLCGITKETDAAVFETPVGRQGLLDLFCNYFQPTIGMITNIGIDHLKQCGTLENYIQAKGEILKGLNNKGTLLLNADDEKTKKISLQSFNGRIVYFGVHTEADYRAINIQYKENGMKFELKHDTESFEAFVPGYGEHQVYNALSAIAAVHQIGLPISEAIERIHSFSNITGHVETFTGYKGATVIDDTWSANPTSIEAALNVLKNITVPGNKKLAVIGSVSLLGDDEAEWHREIGRKMAEYGVDTLITFGSFAKEIAQGAISKNLPHIIICDSSEEAGNAILPLLDNNTTLLLKASMYDHSVSALVKVLKI